MDEEKKKEGMSVKELEGYAKKHRFEVFFLLLFVLAGLFSMIFWGTKLSIFLAAIGAIVAVFIPNQVENISRKLCMFIFKQEKTTQLIIGIVWLIIAIFLAPLIFLMTGLYAGKGMVMHCKEMSMHNQK